MLRAIGRNMVRQAEQQLKPRAGGRTDAARLGAILAERGELSAVDAEIAARAASRLGFRLGEYLLRRELVSEQALLDALAEQSGLSALDLRSAPPDPGLFRPSQAVTYLRMGWIPWRRTPTGDIYAIDEPSSANALPDGCRAVLAATRDLRDHVTRLGAVELARWSETSRLAHTSCRTLRPSAYRRHSLIAGALLAVGLVLAPGVVGLFLIGLALLASISNMGLRSAAAAQRLRAPASRQGGNSIAMPRVLPRVTLLVPLHHEASVVPALAAALRAIDYPPALLDVLFLTEQDDTETRAALEPHIEQTGWASLTVPAGGVRTKPRAMNFALPFSHGDLIGVYDAEDRPDPKQLRKVAARFADLADPVACVQCALGFHNETRNWIARAFSIEYTTWFRLFLPGIARLQVPVPLGGTSVFIKRDVLESLGGWDAWNVTEDAELGILLARRGHRTAVIDSTTLEEVNFRPLAWVRQRSRWLKGFALTWIVHNRQPRELLREIGPRGFIAFQILTGSTVAGFLLAPVMWSLWPVIWGWRHPFLAHLPPATGYALAAIFLALGLTQAALQCCALVLAGKARLIPWLPVMALYWPLATVAAWKAVAEILVRPFYWSKTEHGIDT